MNMYNEENSNDYKNIAKLLKIWNRKINMHKNWDTDAAFDRIKENMQQIDLQRSGKRRKITDVNHDNVFGMRTLKRSSYNWMYRAAAVLAVASLVSLFSIVFFGSDLLKDESKPAVHEVVTEQGHRVKIQLADGTIVNLNVDSKLSYPNFFDPDSRTVYLTGEAYFDVAKEDRPFFVMADDAVIEILGTAFNVSAYEDNPEIRVAVERGMVSLHALENNRREYLTLKNGDLGTLARDGSGTLTVRHNVDLRRYTGWLEQKLVFVDEPLGAVVKQLERWYRVNIELSEPELAGRLLTATFENARLYTVLNVLEMSMELKVHEVEDGSIMIFAK